MAETYFPMLPKINENKNALSFAQTGVWYTDSANVLQKLVSSLATGETLEDVINIDSIPDVWAKPLLFRMALFDLDTTREFVAGLHDRVVGEWRSLLAMFALKNVKQINLKAVHVDLMQDNMPLAKVLKSLAPKESLLGNDQAWLTDIYVIFYNDIPLAMVSPVTLVATAADYSMTFRGRLALPWSKDSKTLTDPIKNLTQDELQSLNAWLKNLYDNLQQMSRTLVQNSVSEDITNNLLKCIRAYQDDVSREIGAMPASTSVSFTSSNLNLYNGAARLLDQTIQGRIPTAEDSAVKLNLNSSRSNKNLLLVSPQLVKSLAQQEGVDAARLVVWQGISANDVTEQSLQGERNKIGTITLTNAEFRRPEDFFYEQMAVVEPGNVFPGSLEIAGTMILANDDTTPILPIKRELAEIFSPKEIQNRLSISEDNDNILLNFNFPLNGVSGKGTEFRFTKKYPKRELIYIQQEVPVIELWPNIRRDGWNKYYLYYENYQAQATGTGAADIPVDDMYYVEPWTFGKELDNDFPAQGLKNCFTAKLSNFPEALILNYKEPNSSSSATEVGLILLNTPELTQRQAGLDWKIGLDFGTSSTMLYYSEGNKKPTPLNFAPHLFKVTESGGARAQTFVNFIASKTPERTDGSFLSIFHMLNLSERNRDEILPLQDGHVLSFIERRIFELLGHRVDTNLKWKEDDIGRLKVKAYIHQICMQALVEAIDRGVDKIYWNFSYPTAFSQEQKSTFETTCRDTLKGVYDNSGFNINLDKEVDIWSESEASACYFNRLDNNFGVNFTDGAICIDIGAGTTDISIISGEDARIVYHTSVQYAGRYMFKPIYDNYGLFADSRTAADVRLEDPEQRNALIDTDMRLNSQKYITGLVNKTGQESIKSVLQGAQFAVAGLFYYLGQILGVLHKENHYVENKLPEIFIGGNGARIFEWLTGGTGIKNNPRLKVLEKIMVDASGLTGGKNFNIHFSHYPKAEVASGMLTGKMYANNDGNNFFDEDRINRELFKEYANDEYICNSVLAGAECMANSENFSPSNSISAYDIRKGLRITAITEFEKFIASFNSAPKLWSDKIPFDEEAADSLIKTANSFYAALKGADLKKIFVEPVFIVELRCFMEMFNYDD